MAPELFDYGYRLAFVVRGKAVCIALPRRYDSLEEALRDHGP